MAKSSSLFQKMEILYGTVISASTSLQRKRNPILDAEFEKVFLCRMFQFRVPIFVYSDCGALHSSAPVDCCETCAVDSKIQMTRKGKLFYADSVVIFNICSTGDLRCLNANRVYASAPKGIIMACL